MAVVVNMFFFFFHLSWKESIIDRLFTAVSKLGFGILWV